MADTRNPREIVDIGKFQPFTHPQYGPGAVREITYLDGTVERRWLHYGTGDDAAPDAGYLVGQPTVDPKVRQVWDQGKPPERAEPVQKPSVVQVEGTPDPSKPDGRDNSKPVMASHWPDGRVTYEPLTGPERTEWDREQAGLPPAPVAKAEADKAAAARQAQQDARQAQIDAETRAQNAATATRQAQADARQAQIDAANTAKAKADADRQNEPQVIYREVKNPDGSTRNVQVRVHPGGREEVIESAIPGQPAPREAIHVQRNPTTGELEEVYRDPTTGRAAVRPVQGAGPAARPSPAPLLPQIVVGQSQDALRTAYTQIQEEVDSGRRTAAWGENRRQEVYGAAELTVREAQLVEQSRQANQTTSFNVSNTVLQYGQSSLENALKFTLSINDKLKPGSGSGGRMFAALFNLQMKMAKDSGIYDLGVPRGSSVGAAGAPGASGRPPGAPGAPAAPPPPRLTNVGDPAAVEADHQRSLAQLASSDAADAAAAAAAPGGRAMTPSYGAPGQPSVRGVAPALVAAPPVISPTQGTIPAGGPSMPPPVPQAQTAAPAAPAAAAPATAPAPVGVPDVGRPAPPLSGQDDPRLDRSPGWPSAPLTGPNDPRIQWESFPALEGLRQQFAAPSIDPSGGLDPTTGGISMPGLPPALQRAQIAATPPWRLPMQDLDSLVEQFGPEDVLGWPGRSLITGGVG